MHLRLWRICLSFRFSDFPSPQASVSCLKSPFSFRLLDLSLFWTAGAGDSSRDRHWHCLTTQIKNVSNKSLYFSLISPSFPLFFFAHSTRAHLRQPPGDNFRGSATIFVFSWIAPATWENQEEHQRRWHREPPPEMTCRSDSESQGDRRRIRVGHLKNLHLGLHDVGQVFCLKDFSEISSRVWRN